MIALAFSVISFTEREAKSTISPSLRVSSAGLSEKPLLTAAQMRAARALAGMEQKPLAKTNTISQVEDTWDAGHITSYQWNFLVLPTGQILVCETDFNNIWIYTPSGEARRRWAP